MLTCMTGISQCQDTNDHSVDYSQLSASERTNCLKDPRYLTWRMMTVKLSYTGSQDWYRTDSHWDSSSFILGSTWGPTIALSSHIGSEKDNNGTSDIAKTYVFAMSDGSGISINHLSYDTIMPTGNSTAGTGANNVISNPATFSNIFPNLYT